MTLSVRVTPAVTSGIVVGLCQLALEGSERLIGQLNTPALDWIWELPWKVAVRCPVHNTCYHHSALCRCRFLRIRLMWQTTLRTFRNLSYLVFACSSRPSRPCAISLLSYSYIAEGLGGKDNRCLDEGGRGRLQGNSNVGL